jgi:hypothetical protein
LKCGTGRIVILGSGLIGLLAKEVFPLATILPFGKSRFYFVCPPLEDDFIVAPADGSEIGQVIGQQTLNFRTVRRAISINGFLASDDIAKSQYVSRVYEDAPSFTTKLLNSNFNVYPVTCHDLYLALLNKRKEEIMQSIEQYGRVLDVAPNVIKCEKSGIEFDLAISTIPLKALSDLTGYLFGRLRAHNIHYYFIGTDSLNFEGADQVLVADSHIGFHKVNRLSQYTYVFNNIGPIPTPEPYFGAFLKNRFDIIGSTSVEDAIPTSPAPDLTQFTKQFMIEAVGSCAQWDDFFDVSSCIQRLIRLRNKG